MRCISRHPRAVLAYAAVCSTALALAACAISRTDEIRMGEEYSAELNKQLTFIRDPELNRYLTMLGDSIARPVDTQGLTWHFYLVDTKEVNAFALPAGYVYVTRGLIERTTTVAQLAGAMGHEIAHVTRHHAARQMERMQQANVGVTLACVLTGVCESEAVRVGVNVGGAAVFARYSRDDERQADEDAVANVVRVGVSPRGIPELLEKLLAERKERPDALSAWFASHPSEEDRIADAKRAIAALDPALLSRLVDDTPNFQRFRSRLLTLTTAALAR